FQKGQKEAIEELQQRAKRMGATGIIGVSLNTDSINVDEKGVLLLITATGTAVKIR
ncbi:MAG: heavy metal-binding domain-containing protein, partial [Prochlorotrichaceae cyanobacterium]